MLIDISPKGELLSDAMRHSDIVTTSTKMEKMKESIEKALNLLNIQREKEIILKGHCGINFRERRFGYTTNWFRKKFDLYDLCFGEHRFAIC